MPTEITIPRLGWSMEEGIFREWLKTDGESIRPGEMLFTLEGEKAAQEIESIDAGTLHIPTNAPRPGDTVRVGQVIGYLLTAAEKPPTLVTPAEQAPVSSSEESQSDTIIETTAIPKKDDIVATPRARRRARELGVDWHKISGSGRDGRIRERDVIGVEPKVPSKLRQTIAQRMLAGSHQTAPVTLFSRADATALVAWRNRAKSAGGHVPTYTEMLIKLVAAVLPACPSLNASWQQDRVVPYDRIDIAVAIDTEQGLLAPVVKKVDQLSLLELSQQFRQLAEQAHAGSLSQDQLKGGTFTITNLGSFDIDYFTPIINLPQTAILGIGRLVREPVVRGDAIVIGETLGLSLTFDHRAIDGAPAARWLQRLCKQIQDPTAILG